MNEGPNCRPPSAWVGRDNVLMLSISSLAVTALIGCFIYSKVRNRKRWIVVLRRKEKELSGAIKMVHTILFLSIIASIASTTGIQLFCPLINKAIFPLIGLALQCIMMMETQCILAANVLNLNTRKVACMSKRFIRVKTILFTLGIPALITMPLNFMLNYYFHNQVHPTIAATLFAENQTMPHTKLQIGLNGTQHEQTPPILVMVGGLTKETVVAITNNPLKRVVQETEYLYNVLDLKSDKIMPICWMTWPSTSLTVAFAISTWGCTSTIIISVVEWMVLRKVERNGKMVSLEEWGALISRPLLSFVVCLKWIAVSLQWYSYSCVYTVYVSWLLTPVLLYTITSPKRSRIYGHIIGKPSTRSRPSETSFCNKGPGDRNCYTTHGIRYKSLSVSDQDSMIQIQEPSRSHVNNDVIINQRLSDFVRDRFDSHQSGTTRLSPIYVGDNGPLKNNQDNSNTNNIRLPETNEAELNLRQNHLVNETGKSSDQGNSEEYGIINETSIVAGMSKCTVSEENRTSVFDDSDYDEVLDFMTSPSPKTNEDGGAGGEASEANESTSSKRSSATSATDSVVSNSSAISTSGIESGDDRPNPKYADLDIAKILHTRKRIHRTLYPSQPTSTEDTKVESHVNLPSGKKKSTSMLKRHTHYGTVGRRSKSQTSSVNTRHSSCSRPSSTGESESIDLSALQAGDYATFDPVRARRQTTCVTNNADDAWFTFDLNKSRTRSKESDSDGSDSNRNSVGAEQNRWSRISSNSQNSDKALLSPHKGPWKAFRKFVNNGSAPRTQSHEEKKASIRLCMNSNLSNNNNNIPSDGKTLAVPNSRLSVIEPADFRSRAEAEQNTSKNTSYNCIASDELEASEEYSYSPNRTAIQEHKSNTLMRRLSRKSSRGRKARRSSLPTQSVWDVRSGNWREGSVSEPAVLSLDLRDSNCQQSAVETQVMKSVERNARSSSVKAKPVSSKPSLKKRLMSFTKKRTPSQSRKSVDTKSQQNLQKENSTESSGGRQMNKALSYSSPQLSVFAVNGKDKNKLQF